MAWHGSSTRFRMAANTRSTCSRCGRLVERLMRDAGFSTVRTYGDFQEHYQEFKPDFFVHVAAKGHRPNELARPYRRDSIGG